MRLDQVSELGMICRLRRMVPGMPDVKVGIGDDTAVVALTDDVDLLLTSDAVIRGVHVDDNAEPEAIGHKALGRALSDIAAMGGEPLWAVVDVVAQKSEKWSFVEGVYAGMLALAHRYEVAIVGGDTSCSGPFSMHVFVAGKVPKNQALLRSGASADQAIYTTGCLGGSLSGKHLLFEPRVNEGRWLRESGFGSAMIDISDGLATDLWHLVRESGVGARIREADLPTVVGTDSALYDGEDYELLFTVEKTKRHEFEERWEQKFELACTKIGRIEAGAVNVTLESLCGDDLQLEPSGYEHF